SITLRADCPEERSSQSGLSQGGHGRRDQNSLSRFVEIVGGPPQFDLVGHSLFHQGVIDIPFVPLTRQRPSEETERHQCPITGLIGSLSDVISGSLWRARKRKSRSSVSLSMYRLNSSGSAFTSLNAEWNPPTSEKSSRPSVARGVRVGLTTSKVRPPSHKPFSMPGIALKFPPT